MIKPSELRIRFDEARRIYGDSPQIQITYKDFERVYQDMTELLELISPDKKVGFK